MPMSPQAFTARIAGLKADIADQGRRVQALLEQAFDAAFVGDVALAARVIAMDDVIDRVDVDIERAAVALLTDATKDGAALPADELRLVLTIVKVNNELERIADNGVAIAELLPEFQRVGLVLPERFRVITNSCVGILRDACGSLERDDAQLAKVVLASEDAVTQFKGAIVRDAQAEVSRGTLTVDAAFALFELTSICETLSEHCTNIAEQALYMLTGRIVRHLGGHWQEVPRA